MSHDDRSDAVLALVQTGDLRGALQLAARHFAPELGRFCFALLSDHALAHEVVIETLVDLHAAMPSLAPEQLAAFLYRRALERCSSHLSERPELPAELREACEGRLPKDPVRARALVARAALAQLKPLERETALLRFMGGLSYDQIADLRALDVEEVKRRIGRALLAARQAQRETTP